jgi:peptide/nickel transport system permease protein
MKKTLRNHMQFFSWTGKAGILFLFIALIIAVCAPLISIYPPNQSSGNALMPPSVNHWFGTDDLGHDLWAQICFGTRISLIIGIGTALLSGFCGGFIGMFSGYQGGIIDKIVMRLIDVMIVLPDLPVMIVLAAFFGPGLLNIIIVLTFFSWVHTARIVRSQVLMLKEKQYVHYIKIHGATSWYIMRKHLFPDIFPLMSVSMIRLTGRAIIAEAGLSFLGLGDPTSKSWGMIIHHATSFHGIYYTNYWKWWLVFPWMALTMMVLSLAFINRDLERLFGHKKPASI